MEYNPADKLDALRLALIKAGEAHNLLTQAYNAYVNELTAIYNEEKVKKELEDELTAIYNEAKLEKEPTDE